MVDKILMNVLLKDLHGHVAEVSIIHSLSLKCEFF